jgi:thiamine-phosphate pyrophosphorylase
VLLPERSYKPSEARTFLRGDGIKAVGAFSRSVTGASRAERGGADYVQVGPTFDGDGPGAAEEGLVLLRKVKDAVHIPVIAFGGIRTPAHVADCLRAGADGVAVTEAVTKAADPQGAAGTLRVAMDAAWRALHGESG